MPKVMIEMEMPKSCSRCKLPKDIECFLRYEAWLSGYFNDNRHEQCPLQEVKECDMALTKEQIEEIRKEICARAGIPYSILFGGKVKE